MGKEMSPSHLTPASTGVSNTCLRTCFRNSAQRPNSIISGSKEAIHRVFAHLCLRLTELKKFGLRTIQREMGRIYQGQ